MSDQIKVSAQFDPDNWHALFNPNYFEHKKKGNACRACGRPLKDKESQKRGYGPECWKEAPVIIVLDIRKDLGE